jgi:hypothetical protein
MIAPRRGQDASSAVLVGKSLEGGFREMAVSPQATGGVRLSYTEDRPGSKRVTEHVGTFDQLVKRLYEIQASRMSPLFIGVNLEDMSDNELAIGLADHKWAVLYGDPQHTQLTYSLGDSHADGDVEFCFEQWEVLPRKYLTPVDKALEVIRTWFMTGELSNDIEWERRSLLAPEGW